MCVCVSILPCQPCPRSLAYTALHQLPLAVTRERVHGHVHSNRHKNDKSSNLPVRVLNSGIIFLHKNALDKLHSLHRGRERGKEGEINTNLIHNQRLNKLAERILPCRGWGLIVSTAHQSTLSHTSRAQHDQLVLTHLLSPRCLYLHAKERHLNRTQIWKK